jgi:hypothetical protein
LGENRQSYQAAGITFTVSSDLPITPQTFSSGIALFRADGPPQDLVRIRHHFSLPDLQEVCLGRQVYRKPPWAIYECDEGWIYLGISPLAGDPRLHKVVRFNRDHSLGDFYHPDTGQFRAGGLTTLTMLSSDQILLARLLGYRRGCLLHASGMLINGSGLAFAGHSGAGKSTLSQMLGELGEILCDDRVILRQWQEGFRLHGIWSQGKLPIFSAANAPLHALFVLEQAPENRLIRLEPSQAVRLLPPFVIKPFVSRD